MIIWLSSLLVLENSRAWAERGFGFSTENERAVFLLDSFQKVRGFRGVLGNPEAYGIAQRVAYPPLRLCTEKFSLGPFLSSLVTQEPSVRIGFSQPPANETSGPLTVIDWAYLPGRNILGMVSPEKLHYQKPEGVQSWGFPPRIIIERAPSSNH